jgi:hypothetical protein
MAEVSGWARVRAALITLALVVHGLYVAPVPHVVTPADFNNPVSQDEVEAWAGRLQALGISITTEALKEEVILWTGRIGGAHRALKRPFAPFLRVTGTGQGWGLFANPNTHPLRLEVRGRRAGGAFESVYLQLDPEADWAWARFAYRGIRGCYDAQGRMRRSHPAYRSFASWAAREAFREHPDLEAVEVRLLRTHTTLPGERLDDTVEVRHARSFERAVAP